MQVRGACIVLTTVLERLNGFSRTLTTVRKSLFTRARSRTRAKRVVGLGTIGFDVRPWISSTAGGQSLTSKDLDFNQV